MPDLLGKIKALDRSPQAQKLAVATLLGCFLLLGLFSMRRQTLTYDEPAHYRYGLQVLSGDSDRFDDSKMPISALNALPGKVSELFPEGAAREKLGQVETGRLVTLLFSALVAYFTFRWSRDLYGFLPGLFSLFLYAFEPNLIAHSQLVTTDLYAAGMVLLSTYTLWLYSRKRDWQHAALFAVTLGLSQLAKYTCIFLYPLLAVTLVVSDAPGLLSKIRGRDWASLRIPLRQYLLLLVFMFAAGLLIINAGFLFNRTLTPLGDYHFKSHLFRELQSRLGALGRLPVAVPYPYLQGLDLVRYVERTGQNYSRIYLLGRLSATGFKNYYLVAWLYKTPLAIQAILALAMGGYLWKWNSKKPNPPSPFPFREGGEVHTVTAPPFSKWERGEVHPATAPPFPKREGGEVHPATAPHFPSREVGLGGLGPFLRNEWFLLAPVLFFTVYFNLFYRAQIGIRFFLVVTPLLLVFCGSLLRGWQRFGRARWGLVAALSFYLAASVLSYFPYYIPYFNELVPDRRFAYKILADSNLDWGQDEWYLQQYLSSHPDAQVSPDRPTAGEILVSANNLVGITAKPDTYRWLRDHFEPVGTVGYAYLIYEVPPEAVGE